MKAVNSCVTGIFLFLSSFLQIMAQGNVGIGTINPTSILQTKIEMPPDTSLIAKAGLFISNSDSTGNGSNPNTVSLLFGREGTPRQAIEGGTYGNDFLRFYTGGNFTTPRMVMNVDGKIGIGTMNPTKLLHVQGGVFLKSVNVDTITGNVFNANQVKGNYFTSINAPQNFLDFDSPGYKLVLDGGIQATQFVDVTNSTYYLAPSSPNVSLRVNGTIMANGFRGEYLNYFMNLNAFDISLKAPGEIHGTRFKDSADTTESFLDLGPNIISMITKGEIRSTLFRDKDNPVFYVDPASTGTSVNTPGVIISKSFKDSDNQSFFIDPASTATSVNTPGNIISRMFVDSDNQGFFIDPSSTTTSVLTSGSVVSNSFKDIGNESFFIDPAAIAISINTNGSIHANGEIRTPSFLDKDNPDYYLDPSAPGTSLKSNGKVIATAFKDASDTTLLLDPSSTTISLNVLGTIQTNGEFKSPIYKDRDDPAYYLDPASTGISLFTNGEIRSTKFTDKDDTNYYMDPASPGICINANGEIRSRNFKDMDNANYLVDPADGSKLRNLVLDPLGTGSAHGLKIEAGGTDVWTINAFGASDDDLSFWYNGVLLAYLNWETGVGALDFTAQHRSLPGQGNSSDYAKLEGYIVVSNGQVANLDGGTRPKIDEALPRVELSDRPNDQRIYGVIAGVESASDSSPDDKMNRSYAQGAFVSVFPRADTSDFRIIINSAGEGGIWVSNYNGNIRNGDLVTTSPIPGIGMKQQDDLIHNYTVAKVVMDCEFDLNSKQYECREVVHEGKIYVMAFLGCVYKL